jgi:hypothetical protein
MLPANDAMADAYNRANNRPGLVKYASTHIYTASAIAFASPRHARASHTRKRLKIHTFSTRKGLATVNPCHSPAALITTQTGIRYHTFQPRQRTAGAENREENSFVSMSRCLLPFSHFML